MKIGNLIRLLRTADNLSQTELAEFLGISRANLSQIENGHKDPGLPVLRKIAEYFRIPLPVLLADEAGEDSEVNQMLNKMLGDVLLMRKSWKEDKARKGKAKEPARKSG